MPRNAPKSGDRKKKAPQKKSGEKRNRSSAAQKKKKVVKKEKEKVVYDASATDPSLPMPIGLKLVGKVEMNSLDGQVTFQWKKCTILERKVRPGVLELCPPGINPLPLGAHVPDDLAGDKGKNKGKKNDRKDNSSSSSAAGEDTMSPAESAASQKRKRANLDAKEHAYMYYVHFDNWDRRMDAWLERVDMKIGEDAAPSATPAAPEESAGGPPDPKRRKTGDAKNAEASPSPADEEGQPVKFTAKTGSKGKEKGKGKGKSLGDADEDEHSEESEDHGGDGGHGGSLHHGFSEEDLKAHEEATKVKNIDVIVIGQYSITTWYYAPFPEKYNKFSTLYFCEFCLNFFGYKSEHDRHMKVCQIRHPPGNEIYRSQEKGVKIAVFEVDGYKEKIYCQNLCFIAKLFLDHKTLEYDCTPFLFYVICEVDEHGARMVGYFSKEKRSQAGYNLACILTLPCHQRKGYGSFIISFSYELSKLENTPGAPEKPISDLGLVSYRSYWGRTLLEIFKNKKSNDSMSIQALSRMTMFTTQDVIDTLRYLRLLVWTRSSWVFNMSRLKELLIENEASKKRKAELLKDPTRIYVHPCRPELLHWTPFFSKGHRRLKDQPGL